MGACVMEQRRGLKNKNLVIVAGGNLKPQQSKNYNIIDDVRHFTKLRWVQRIHHMDYVIIRFYGYTTHGTYIKINKTSQLHILCNSTVLPTNHDRV